MADKKQTPHKQVEEIMHYGVITCRLDTLLKEVVRIIADTDVHALIVVDDNGCVVGVVSHVDLLSLYGQNLLTHTAKDVMRAEVITISPQAAVKDAVALMLEHQIRRLVVTEKTPVGERPLGVISTTDVIRDMRGQPWFW